jgi:SAM-dependent methyltransferase
MLGIAGITALAAFLWVAAHKPEPRASFVTRSRDFYGVLSVWHVDEGAARGAVLRHGAILHGHQYLDPPELRTTPTTYFYPESGVGRALGEASPLPRPRRVGILGLGTGTIAAYARAGDAYRFYEISPSVLRYAREHFTYVVDAAARGATVDVVLGDGRLSLEREPDQRFDALVLDAFSGDAIPVHLLTQEAFDVYRRHLAPGGVVCVHLSNKHVDLIPVVAAAARRLGWPAVLVRTELGRDGIAFPADWVVSGPDAARLDALRIPDGVSLAGHTPQFAPWTDERADILGVIR